MSGALSAVDLLGIVGPIVFYIVSLAVYFVYEGKRERELEEEYGEELISNGS